MQNQESSGLVVRFLRYYVADDHVERHETTSEWRETAVDKVINPTEGYFDAVELGVNHGFDMPSAVYGYEYHFADSGSPHWSTDATDELPMSVIDSSGTSRAAQARSRRSTLDVAVEVTTAVQADNFAVSSLINALPAPDLSLSPWPQHEHTVGVVWDTTVGQHAHECDSRSNPLSPATPIQCEAARVDSSFTMRLPQTDDQARFWSSHPLCNWFTSGVRFGFSTMSSFSPQRRDCRNAVMEPHTEEQVHTWVTKQCSHGKMVDVTEWASDTRLPAVFSPFTTVPKAGGDPGEVRVCHNLSFPFAGASPNSTTCFTALEPIELASLDTVAARIRFLKEQSSTPIYAARLDFSAYFRQIPISRRCQWLMLQRLRGRAFVHRCCSFGAAAAPHTAAALSSMLCDYLAHRGHFAVSFIDDFILIDSLTRVWQAIGILRQAMTECGFAENVSKFVAPTQKLSILGVWFDLENGAVSLTADRRATLIAAISAHAGVNVVPDKMTVNQIQQLAGKLNFVSAVIPLSRGYIGPLWMLLAKVDHLPPSYRVRLGKEVASALQWWLCMITKPMFSIAGLYTGLVHRGPSLIVLAGLQSDAADYGFAALSMVHRTFIRGQWTVDDLAMSINARELATIVIFAAVMAPRLSGCVVIFETDSFVSVFALHRKHSRHPIINSLVSFVSAIQQRFRFLLSVRHICGKRNVACDQLSRGAHPCSSLPSPTKEWSECWIHPDLRQLGCNVSWTWEMARSLDRPEQPSRPASNTSSSSFANEIRESSAPMVDTPMPFLYYYPLLRASPVVSM